jgi:ERCC4-type nuclease
MQPHEIDNMLETLVILVDKREQPTERAKKRYESFGVPYKRVTLSYGDYAYNAQLPNGQWIFDEEQTVKPLLAFERKMNLDELAQCFTHSRSRFQREFERAKEQGARIFLIVENGSWENLLAGKYRSKFNHNAFLASLAAWIVRYDLQIIFCKQEISGRLIKEFLYRDLKDRAEKGEFDNMGAT